MNILHTLKHSIMNKLERTKLKKKGRRLYWVAYLMGFGAVGLLISLFTIKPLGELLRSGFNSENFTLQILSVAAVVVPIMIPLFGSLIVAGKASWMFRDLYDYKKELYSKQNKFHMKLFWDAVRKEDYNEAKRLYNLDNFIWGSERVLCNGILMGIATQLPIDVDWAKKVDDRMNSYL